MAQSKKSTQKNSKEEHVVADRPKKEFEYEIADPIADKIEDDEISDEMAEDGELGSDGPDLDDEELNPFKDKWEE